MGGPGSGGKIGKRGPYAKTKEKRKVKAARAEQEAVRESRKAACTVNGYVVQPSNKWPFRSAANPWWVSKLENARRSERIAEEAAETSAAAAAAAAADEAAPPKQGSIASFFKKHA